MADAEGGVRLRSAKFESKVAIVIVESRKEVFGQRPTRRVGNSRFEREGKTQDAAITSTREAQAGGFIC